MQQDHDQIFSHQDDEQLDELANNRDRSLPKHRAVERGRVETHQHASRARADALQDRVRTASEHQRALEQRVEREAPQELGQISIEASDELLRHGGLLPAAATSEFGANRALDETPDCGTRLVQGSTAKACFPR